MEHGSNMIQQDSGSSLGMAPEIRVSSVFHPWLKPSCAGFCVLCVGMVLTRFIPVEITEPQHTDSL